MLTSPTADSSASRDRIRARLDGFTDSPGFTGFAGSMWQSWSRVSFRTGPRFSITSARMIQYRRTALSLSSGHSGTQSCSWLV
ncbi:hypothetical protein ABZ820_33735 [Streptomyces diacarni]|uniref:hypothetical protein n=1 Tax=Streptomyces diacarni TaxID=2800381 RepID=UPI0033E982F5